MAPAPLPATPWPTQTLARLRGVLCDIDGTLTTAGRMSAAAYDALERLGAGGLLVVPVTGRPAGWCDLIARFWPVAAVVGENGAFYFRHDDAHCCMNRRYARSDTQRRQDRARLREIGESVLRAVPGTRIAADQAYRETDLAIDWCEDVPALPAAEVRRIVELLRSHGLTVKLSSIHVNAWFGSHDKLSMTRLLMQQEFGVDLDAERESFAYVGDSPNDEPLFAFLPNSFAVANIAAFAAKMGHPPAYVITDAREGSGFVEFARQVLAARGAVA